MLLLFKLLLVPVIILLISLAGRMWGPRLSGVLGGFPVIAGPIIIFLTLDHGIEFGVTSAKAALTGVISIGLFSFIYAIASQRYGIFLCLLAGLVAFIFSTLIFLFVDLSIIWTFILVLAFLVTFLLAFPTFENTSKKYQITNLDIIARMVAAAILVLAITFSSEQLGPKLSGLLAPFPIAGTILAGFTHHSCGNSAARRLLDGFLRGLFGMAIFTLTLATLLPILDMWMTILIGAILAISSSSITIGWSCPPVRNIIE